jgi:nitrous oxidase accessory protein NosD
MNTLKHLFQSLFLLTVLLAPPAGAQCDPDSQMGNCVSKLATGYTFLKSYKISGEKEIEYSYVFTKDTNYVLNLCNKNGESSNMVVTLYDANRNKIASNVVGDRYLPAIGYRCGATGIYYFTISFQNNFEPCGVSVLGFKR